MQGVLFDLNGTLSDDEGVYFEVYREMFAERGVGLSREEYFGSLVGHADEVIFRTGLAADGTELERLLADRVTRYRARIAGGSTVPATARGAVRAAGRSVPVGVVTGAFRVEAEELLAGAGLLGEIRFLVTAEDVTRLKPDPEPYLVAIERLGGIEPSHVVAFEDTAVGVEAARAAGLYVVGVAGTLPPGRLGAAHEVVEALDEQVVERFLRGGTPGSPTDPLLSRAAGPSGVGGAGVSPAGSDVASRSLSLPPG